MGSEAGGRGAHGGGAARASADAIRSGNDQVDGLLPRDRELFAALFRTAAGRASADAAGLFSARLYFVCGREPRDDSAGAWDVVWGSEPQAEPGGLRVQVAVGEGQQAAEV